MENTWSTDMRPGSPEEFVMMDATDGGKLELLPVMMGELFLKAVNYPVIVESWQKVKAGRHKKAWEAAFTPAERNKISRYYGRFYRWYLVTGHPRRVSCRPRTIVLLQRAVAFFAGLA